MVMVHVYVQSSTRLSILPLPFQYWTCNFSHVFRHVPPLFEVFVQHVSNWFPKINVDIFLQHEVDFFLPYEVYVFLHSEYIMEKYGKAI